VNAPKRRPSKNVFAEAGVTDEVNAATLNSHLHSGLPRFLRDTMLPAIEQLDLRNADAVVAALTAGAHANGQASCRRGSIDHVATPGAKLIATGDLHDNPLHLARLVRAAGFESADAADHKHLTLHELIHSDRLVNGMDFSYRVLARVAALKAAFPEFVHVLLANHELAQMTGSEVAKDGIRFVEAFDEAIDFAFGDDAPRVRKAVKSFIRSMPIALRMAHGSMRRSWSASSSMTTTSPAPVPRTSWCGGGTRRRNRLRSSRSDGA
jgi:hypothetical protein